MKGYIEKFLKDFDYPQDCGNEVLRGYDAISSGKCARAFNELIALYDKNEALDFKGFIAKIETELSGALNNKYLAYLITFIALTRRLYARYIEKGIGEDVYMLTAVDIKYKAVECKLVKGEWGIFCPDWFSNHFSMKLFGFENLQFKFSSAANDYNCNGYKIEKGTPIIEVHIPRTGGRLDHDGVLKAYAEAAEFFKKHFAIKKVIFYCGSWLLFPKNLEILKPQSNLAQFISDFTIVETSYYDDYSQVWRLFDMDYTGDPDALPADTSFRRGYVDLIRRGEKTGYGIGFIIY